MAKTQNFTVTSEDGWLGLPASTTRLVQTDYDNVYMAEAASALELADELGELMTRQVPYTLDETILYFVKSPYPGAASVLSIVAP